MHKVVLHKELQLQRLHKEVTLTSCFLKIKFEGIKSRRLHFIEFMLGLYYKYVCRVYSSPLMANSFPFCHSYFFSAVLCMPMPFLISISIYHVFRCYQ